MGLANFLTHLDSPDVVKPTSALPCGVKQMLKIICSRYLRKELSFKTFNEDVWASQNARQFSQSQDGSDVSVIDLFTSAPLGPVGGVKNLQVTDPTTSSLRVRWEPAEGDVRQYQIIYVPAAGGTDSMVSAHPQGNDGFSLMRPRWLCSRARHLEEDAVSLIFIQSFVLHRLRCLGCRPTPC